jgi:hypothetical protein
MLIPYRARAAVTSLVLIAGLDPPAWAGGLPPCATLDRQLFSARAIHRIRTAIQIRLLELRKERLRLVERAVLTHLPVRLLIAEESQLPADNLCTCGNRDVGERFEDRVGYDRCSKRSLRLDSRRTDLGLRARLGDTPHRRR